MNGITIPLELGNYRRRALESQACVGEHAWDIGNWDAESDAEAYCLDALEVMPAGSTRGWAGALPVGRRFVRQS